jgi:hypothetical protein
MNKKLQKNQRMQICKHNFVKVDHRYSYDKETGAVFQIDKFDCIFCGKIKHTKNKGGESC